MKERARCSGCGTGLSREVRRCSTCGRRVVSAWEREEEPQSFDYKPLIAPLIVIGLLALLGLLMFYDIDI